MSYKEREIEIEIVIVKVVFIGFLINLRYYLSLFYNYGSKYQQNFHKLTQQAINFTISLQIWRQRNTHSNCLFYV